MSNSKVLIIGGGNMGTVFACRFASKGYTVNIFTSRPGQFQKDGRFNKLVISDSEGRINCEGSIDLATDDISTAMEGCSLIFVTLPAFMFHDLSVRMAPFINEGTLLGIIPGAGGAEFSFKECTDKGAELFGLQRVPVIARLKCYGQCVRAEGWKEKLYLAAMHTEYSQKMAALMEDVFEIPCMTLPNYLNVTLTPSNPILHTARLCAMFRHYKPGMFYDRNPLFYEEWDMESSELMLACDDELQEMIRKMNKLDLSMVRSLREHYESTDAKSLTAKLRSLKGLSGIASPMICTEKGWIPDLNSRYFTADFPYGLSIIIQFAHVSGTDVPHMEFVMEWYKKLTGRTQDFDLSGCGIKTLDDIYKFYGAKI